MACVRQTVKWRTWLKSYHQLTIERLERLTWGSWHCQDAVLWEASLHERLDDWIDAHWPSEFFLGNPITRQFWTHFADICSLIHLRFIWDAFEAHIANRMPIGRNFPSNSNSSVHSAAYLTGLYKSYKLFKTKKKTSLWDQLSSPLNSFPNAIRPARVVRAYDLPWTPWTKGRLQDSSSLLKLVHKNFFCFPSKSRVLIPDHCVLQSSLFVNKPFGYIICKLQCNLQT